MKNRQGIKIAFQGEKGAYSESAAYCFFGNSTQTFSCRRFSDVFKNLKISKVNYGVVPIENSIEGSVNPVYDCFLEFNHKVCGEIILKINHCLIVNPKTRLEDIRVIYSHPQALGQCRIFLENMDAEIISTYDTAGSVKIIKERKLYNAGAIAGERAARLYSMNIIAREISDNLNNYTRFFILSKKEASASGNDKTSIIFSAKHKPGALYKILREFAERNINLTKIESRPTKQKPWEYFFYLDFDGHKTESKPAEALVELRKRAIFVKILGSYPKAIKKHVIF
jgi:chorismate mutase/prephenate dehydratase